jgi:hypothetical protein
MLKNFGSKIKVQQADKVEFFETSNGNPGNLIVSLSAMDGPATPATVLFNDQIPPPNPAKVPIQNPPVPPLALGLYLLSWSFIPIGKPWNTMTEIKVNGVAVFQRAQSDATAPIGSGFVRLEVL